MTKNTDLKNLVWAALQARFWNKVNPIDLLCPEGCWNWAGTRDRGYGKFRIPLIDRIDWANRVAWVLVNGPIPDEMEVCHNCPGGDNPRCVNPSHMFLGTRADNARDYSIKHQRRPVCKHGHDLTKEGAIVMKAGKRKCRECYIRNKRDSRKRTGERKREALGL